MRAIYAFLAALLLCCAIPAGARNLPVKIGKAAFTLLRNSDDPEKLPLLRVKNDADVPAEFLVTATLTRPDGTVVEQAESKLAAAPGSTAETELFGGKRREVKGEILLCHAKLRTGGGGKAEISGIFGTPAPVGRERAGLIGMNVHLSRYRASTRWRLLQMMKEAGVVTVRVDSVFPAPGDVQARRDAIDKIREDLLALEAFGLHSVVCIAYFNAPFYTSAEKQKMAYEWGRQVAEAVRGRTGFHFGNETNSGWSAYGAAADMAALNAAFALGTAAGDPAAERGSFGIAEGPASYVRAFCETGVMRHLDALAIHPYCGTPEAGIAKSVTAKNTMRSLGLEREVWATEVGFHVDRGEGSLNRTTGELTGVTGFSAGLQRQLLPRLYLLAASHGIDRVYWYDFFGRGDPETFWLVEPDFTPRPAWHALKTVSRYLDGAVPVDHTDLELPVQRHLFRRPDGSLLLACWAQQSKMKADFKLPARCRLFDDFGKPVALPEDGRPELGHGVLYVTGLTPEELPQLHAPQILLSGLDARSFRQPAQRFHVKPGETFEIPVVAFNGSGRAARITPFAVRGIPGWRITQPEAFPASAGENATAAVRVEVPENAVPGVEYGLTLQALVDDLQLTQPYTVRIKVDGEFPWQAVRDYRRNADYPMWDPMREAKLPVGNPLLEAERASAVVDGDLSEWKPEEFYEIDQKFAGAQRDPGPVSDLDWSGKVALRWDETHLYAAFLIRDDELCFPDFLSRDWRDSDNIRLMLSSVAERKNRSKSISQDDLLLVISPTGLTHTEGPRAAAAALGGFVRKGVEQQVRLAARVWKNGYALETAIPFELIRLKPESGRIIGLNVMADDSDANHRQHVMMTRGENLLYWRSPASTGDLRLK